LSDVRVKDVHRLFEVELEVIKRNGVEDLYKNGVYKNTLDYYMDTFLIQIIDQNEMVSLPNFRALYQKLLGLFCQKIKTDRIKLNKKDHIGWRCTNLLLSVLKRKRLATIKTIKNQ
jgi:hypothetical protein